MKELTKKQNQLLIKLYEDHKFDWFGENSVRRDLREIKALVKKFQIEERKEGFFTYYRLVDWKSQND